MKKFVLVLASAVAFAGSVFAQDTFFPGFQMAVKGGVAETVGETKITNLLSPAAALDFGYQFTPVFSLRADLSGWQGKGWYVNLGEGYKFNYAQVAIDAQFDLCNLFAGYKTRTLNPYVFLGVGGNARFNNGAQLAKLPTDNLYWDGTKFSTVARVGGGVDIRLTDLLALEIEFVENANTDKFNSKKGDFMDHQLDLLAGLKFNFGQAKGKKAAAAAAEAAAAAAAAQAAAAAARAQQELDEAIAAAQKAIDNAKAALAANDYAPEDIAAINDAIKAVKAAVDAKDVPAIYKAIDDLNAAVAAADANLAAAKAAAEKAAAEKAAYEAARANALEEAMAAAKNGNNNVYYIIGKYDIRDSQRYKINRLIKKLKADPEATAVIVGFADKYTGEPEGNWVLSENRAQGVAEEIVAAGIDASRVQAFWFGDTEQVSKIAERNRVSVLLAK